MVQLLLIRERDSTQVQALVGMVDLLEGREALAVSLVQDLEEGADSVPTSISRIYSVRLQEEDGGIEERSGRLSNKRKF